MSNLELLDRREIKFQPPFEELKEESNARHVHNYLKNKGQLSPTESEWIEKWRKEQWM